MTSKLRIVVFTAGEWTFDREQILRALLADERLEVGLIVIDEYRRPIWRRARFLLRIWGPWKLAASMLATLAHKIAGSSRQLLRGWHDRFVPPVAARNAAEPASVRVVRVADINAPATIDLVAEAKPDLGMILGGRILKPALIETPRLGTLNIHKHDVRRYRGGAEIGYPEILNADRELGLTVHWATADVDAGAIVATGRIPVQKFDTIGSLKLKAACALIDLYAGAVRAIPGNPRQPGTPAEPLGPVLYSTPVIDRIVQERDIDRRRRRFARAEATLGLSPFRVRTARALRTGLAYLALPYLKTKREQLTAQGRAPVVILYYHGIGNAAENWMTLDLVSFHRQVEYLQRYFDVLPLDTAVAALRTERRRPAVVLTFDDGYASALDELLPYLKARNLPATFFVCAAAADGGFTLQHDLERGFGRVPLMDATAWKQIADSGFEIGCHGYAHEDMATLTEPQLRHAMIAAADTISARIGRPVRYFSFPFGNRRNMSDEALRVAAERFDAVFSAYGGYNIPGRSGPFHFTRFSNPADIGSLTAIMNGLHRTTPYYRDLP